MKPTSFGDLRSAVQRPPGPDAWRSLCQMMQRFDQKSFHEQALPYLRSHLDRWPDALRCAPRSWVQRAASGEDLPQLAMTRRLRFSSAVQVFDGDEDFAGLTPFDLPFATQSSISVYQLTHDDLERLVGSPHLAGLEHLELTGHQFDDVGAEIIAHAASPERLLTLELTYNLIGDRGARALADSTTLSSLRRLVLRQNALSDGGARAIATSTFWTSLEHLDISDTMVTTPGVRAIAGALERSGLAYLDLSYCKGVDPHGVTELARAPGLERLSCLDLDGITLSDDAALELARSPHTRNLEFLHLSLGGLSAHAITALYESPHIPEGALMD